MKKSSQFKFGVILMLLMITFPYFVQAKNVAFPSLTQAGTATLTENTGKWKFSNSLFSASYLIQEGKLFFNGSSEMSLEGGTEIFQIVLGDGTKVNASQMSWGAIEAVDLAGDATATVYSETLPGKALKAILTYNSLKLEWRAVLRDGSHYLRTELAISTTQNTPFQSIIPMIYKVLNNGNAAPAVVGNTRGAVVASEHIFAGLETPLAFNTVSGSTNLNFKVNSWTPEAWVAAETVPAGITNLGFSESQIVASQGLVKVSDAGTWSFKFEYQSGAHRMNLSGVDLLKNGVVVASDYHIGYTGNSASANIYTLNFAEAGDYTLRYWGETKTETINSSGKITVTRSGATTPPATITAITNTGVDPVSTITGKWSRNTTLKTTDVFKVSSVIGLVAEGQQRRSFLSYLERERAVPWRSFSVYNSWYELNINRSNDSNPYNRMTEPKCVPVIYSWKVNLFDRYGVSVNAFVWDDGWDEFNSLWNFHVGFPKGFTNLDKQALIQGAGTGAWLGPVGGYGSSKQQRLNFWNSTHDPDISNFELSNKEYFDAFVGRCSQMVDDYDMRYFKFDGISAQYEAYGPSGEEDAEGILKVINALRQKRPDIFINTTVGTWASPFWLNHSDCVWRQRDDFDVIGDQGNNREKWITYRDQLVYKNFVQGSPLAPINSIMTHGLIVTKYGPPAVMPRDNSEGTKKGILKEMRCAFASGTNMVELYLDRDLMTNIGNGELWKELAEAIKWHRENEDVLADAHWVGGNPWDGAKANVYGWASWNSVKSTLALRNPSGITQTFKTTLRQALDIPTYVSGKIKLSDAFSGQTQYDGITGEEIDIDAELTFNLPAFDVVVFNGVNSDVFSSVKTTKKKDDALAEIIGENLKILFRNVVENPDVQVLDTRGAMIASKANTTSDFEIKVPQAGIYVVNILGVNGKNQSQKVICY